MYYYIYIIDLLDNSGRYYIGQRTSKVKPEEDTQCKGSGVNLVKYYNSLGGYKVVTEGKDYTKTILKECNSLLELGEAERYYIGDNYVEDKFCINCKAGTSNKGRDKGNITKFSSRNITLPVEILYLLSTTSALSTLIILLEYSKQGIVRITKKDRIDICKKLRISEQSFYNHVNDLKEKGIMEGEGGYYTLSPQIKLSSDIK